MKHILALTTLMLLVSCGGAPTPAVTALPTYTPYPTNTPQPTYTPYPTNTPDPTATSTPLPSPTKTPEPTLTSTPKPTLAATNTPAVKPSSAPTQAAHVAAATSTSQPTTSGINPGITPVIQKVGYERWGRPLYLDNPKETNCGRTDDSRPVLQLQVSLAFVNNTKQVWKTNTRSLQFFKTNGQVATWCYYDFQWGKDYPPTNPGESYQYTYDVFVEVNERVGYAIFSVEGVGWTRVDIPSNVPTP
jgi:hypothetical protein